MNEDQHNGNPNKLVSKTGEHKPLNKEDVDNHRRSVSQVQQIQYSGPIPTPKILQGYKDVHPDAVDWILKTADSEKKNRHKQENRSSRTRSFCIIFATICMFPLAYYVGTVNPWGTGFVLLASACVIYSLKRN